MTTLENLYYGNIAPHEYEVERGSEYDATAKLVIRHEQQIKTELNRKRTVQASEKLQEWLTKAILGA